MANKKVPLKSMLEALPSCQGWCFLGSRGYWKWKLGEDLKPN